ncbi:MAG: hypothetical protein EXR67_06060 [Dehalococcoidia bacterium]|nr:hypothetical protein [Dehalococcoidia bacterium]
MRPRHSSLTAVAQPPTIAGADLGCKHFWLIDTPTGPASRGTCKHCGQMKEFRNYLEAASYWDDSDDAPEAVAAGSRKPADAPVEAEE